ncbi:putative acetyl-CoA acetyltransferase [Mycobacterium sp. smrl_JER01]
MSREAVICEPVRTPIGRYGGMFKSLTAVELGVSALQGLLARTGVAAETVEDVIVGHCYPSMEAPAIGRVIALDAGLPVTVAGMQVDRRCGSGLQAVIQAVMQVACGGNDLVVAGGTESMTNAVFHSTDMRWGGERTGITVHDALKRGRTTAGGKNHPVPGGMLETAENLRREYRIPRTEQDELAVVSHRRAIAAQQEGLLAETIIPVTVSTRSGEQILDTDEHPRADTSVESLAKLKPVLGASDPAATVTAGNSSGQNDGAAMCLVTTPQKAAELGLRPLVRLVSWGVVGCRRGGARRHGHRPGSGHRGRAEQGRSAAVRYRPDRAQRGFRRPSPGLYARVELRGW